MHTQLDVQNRLQSRGLQLRIRFGIGKYVGGSLRVLPERNKQLDVRHRIGHHCSISLQPPPPAQPGEGEVLDDVLEVKGCTFQDLPEAWGEKFGQVFHEEGDQWTYVCYVCMYSYVCLFGCGCGSIHCKSQ